MWRVVKTLRNIGSRFRSLYANQPAPSTCDDCSTTSSNITDRSVVPTYPFTDTNRNDSKERKRGQEKCRSKRTCHNRPPHLDASTCSFLEALGWSTAALFGVQQYVSLQREKRTVTEDVKPKSGCTPHCLLSQYVFTAARLPFGDQLVRTILPKNQTKLESKTVQQERPSTETPYDFSSILSLVPESSTPPPPALKDHSPDTNVLPPEKAEVDNPVSAAARELQAVTDLCVATIQNNVGIQLSHKDQPVAALPFFLAGCELGYSKACFNAAVCYEMGLGTEKDLTKAKEMYEAAVNKGHVAAMYNLGVYYKEGIGNVPKDIEKSLDLFEKAAAAGLKEAQRALGLHYIQNEEATKAIPLLEAASKQKDPQAEYYLGVCYENGWGIEENMAKAADLYSKAAQKGHLDAMYNLGVFYELGLGGIPQQLDAALDLYKKVSATGHVEATDRAKYVEEQISMEWRLHDEELLTDPESFRLHSSASAPELHLRARAETFCSAPLAKSNSSNMLDLANVFSAFTEQKTCSKQNGARQPSDMWGHHNELGQTHTLEVPWVGV